MISFDSEKALEDALYEKLKGGYNPISDTHHDHVIRQFNIAGHGIVDLITVQVMNDPIVNGPTHLSIDLIELKNTKIKSEHIGQIARYRSAFRRAIDDGYFEFFEVEVSCILVGLKTFPDETDLVYQIQESEWLSVNEMSISFDEGIKFHEVSNWRSAREDHGKLVESIELLIDGEPQ
jgi:hypothetical protein